MVIDGAGSKTAVRQRRNRREYRECCWLLVMVVAVKWTVVRRQNVGGTREQKGIKRDIWGLMQVVWGNSGVYQGMKGVAQEEEWENKRDNEGLECQ